MAGYSRGGGSGKPNLVQERPPLPGGLVYSDVTVNYSFQGFPSVSIKAEGIAENKFNSVRSAYKLASKVALFGIEFEVTQFGWTREAFSYKGSTYATYSISVNYQPIIQRKLESGIKVKKLGTAYSLGAKTTNKKKKSKKKKKEPKISLQKLCSLIGVGYSGPEVLVKIPEDREAEFNIGSLVGEAARSKGCFIEYGSGVKLIPWDSPTGGVSIAAGDVFVDGENTETFVPTYQGVELSWDREEEEEEEEEEDEQEPDDDDQKNELPPRYDFVRVQPKIETITEQDEDFDKPPPDTKVIRGMDSLFGRSGPTRKRTRTTLYDGSELESEMEIWGFVYQVKDLHVRDGQLFSDRPDLFWKRCEWNKTNRVYEPIGTVSLQVTGINKAKKSLDQTVRLVLHPDYKNLGKISSFAAQGYMFSFQPKVEYLTKIISIGFKVMPLENEPGSGQSLEDCINPDENPRAKVQIPLAIPKADFTAYRLGSARSYYREEEQNQNLPYQIEFKTFAELEPRIQDEVRWQIDIKPMGPNDLIGVVTPDLGYQEPMVVLTESRTTNSFMYAADPDSTDEQPIPPLVTGEEGYFRLDRTILSKDKYREAITEYTATDPGFKASLTISRTAEKTGQAPQGESRQVRYDKKENEDWWLKFTQYQYRIYNGTAKKPKQEKLLPRYFVNSDRQKEGNPTSGSLSFPYAKSLGEALKAAKVALEMEHCQNAGQHSKSISWYFPNIRDGRRVSIGGQDFRVLSASVSLEQIGSGVIKHISEFAQITQGTKVTLGPDVPRSVTSYRVKDDSENPMNDPMNPDQGSAPAGDGEAKSTFLGGTTELGRTLQPDSTRRKF